MGEEVKDLCFRPHSRSPETFVAETALGTLAIVNKDLMDGGWVVRLGSMSGCDDSGKVIKFETAKQAQDACNAEHKRLIAEWV